MDKSIASPFFDSRCICRVQWQTLAQCWLLWTSKVTECHQMRLNGYIQ